MPMATTVSSACMAMKTGCFLVQYLVRGGVGVGLGVGLGLGVGVGVGLGLGLGLGLG